MWICTNVGFISVVEDPKAPSVLKVRARNRAHLEALFPGRKIHESAHTDYRFRVYVARGEVACVVSDAIMGYEGTPGAVTYPNFKDSVKDPALHDLYGDFWALHWRYQRAIEALKVPIKASVRAAALLAGAGFVKKARSRGEATR